MTIEENRILILYVSFGFQPDSIIEQVEIQARVLLLHLRIVEF